MWTSKSSVTVACFLPARAKDLSVPLYYAIQGCSQGGGITMVVNVVRD